MGAPDSSLPIACALTPGEIRDRRSSLWPGLVERADSVETTPDGYALRFAASRDALLAIADAIDAERRCCPFLTFDLDVEAQSGPMTLTVSGPPGTQEFLASLLLL